MIQRVMQNTLSLPLNSEILVKVLQLLFIWKHNTPCNGCSRKFFFHKFSWDIPSLLKEKVSFLIFQAKRNAGLHWKNTFRKRYPFIIFSFTKLYFNTNVLNLMWTFVSTFILFSYANPFGINENFKCWNSYRIKLVAQITARFITDKSFIKVLLFDRNVALAQENPYIYICLLLYFPFFAVEFLISTFILA